MSTTKASSYSAPALEKGIDILELLAEKKEPMSLVQIATSLNRSKSQIYRMLASLESRGYLIKEQNSDSFQISNKLFDLGMGARPVNTIVEAAYPVMHSLSDSIFQSCHLVVASGARAVVVARAENPSSIGFSVRTGYHIKLYKSSSGLVLMAWMPKEQKSKLYQEYANSPGFDPKQTDALLEDVRSKGYSRLPSHYVSKAVEDLSFPIYIHGNKVIAALGVPFLKTDIKSTPTIDVALKETKSAAEHLSEISARFGGA